MSVTALILHQKISLPPHGGVHLKKNEVVMFDTCLIISRITETLLLILNVRVLNVVLKNLTSLQHAVSL